ncbi:hypothetical protein [uncultured Corynebacterium sp.]|uniref:hypothetical protein n=1 Tax=uncultured Corynebacterium sp. TaxID=159447 RepID=UPI002804F7DE|nr:hypothetical protein [uncultured Corynebacterium sp.]
MKNLVVVSAGVSAPSTTRILADRIAEAVEAQVPKRGEGSILSTSSCANSLSASAL